MLPNIHVCPRNEEYLQPGTTTTVCIVSDVLESWKYAYSGYEWDVLPKSDAVHTWARWAPEIRREVEAVQSLSWHSAGFVRAVLGEFHHFLFSLCSFFHSTRMIQARTHHVRAIWPRFTSFPITCYSLFRMCAVCGKTWLPPSWGSLQDMGSEHK